MAVDFYNLVRLGISIYQHNMSCQMNAFGAIVDLEGIKKCLYVNEISKQNHPRGTVSLNNIVGG